MPTFIFSLVLFVALISSGSAHAQELSSWQIPDNHDVFGARGTSEEPSMLGQVLSQEPVEEASKPAVGRIVPELFIGLLGAVVGSFPGAYVGASLGIDYSADDPDLLGAVMGFGVGAGVGSAYGIYLVGRAVGGNGTYWETLIGGLVGAGVYIAILPSLSVDNPSFLSAAWGLPTLGSLIAYEMSDSRVRNRKKSETTNRLTPIVASPRGGGIGLGFSYCF